MASFRVLFAGSSRVLLRDLTNDSIWRFQKFYFYDESRMCLVRERICAQVPAEY